MEEAFDSGFLSGEECHELVQSLLLWTALACIVYIFPSNLVCSPCFSLLLLSSDRCAYACFAFFSSLLLFPAFFCYPLLCPCSPALLCSCTFLPSHALLRPSPSPHPHRPSAFNAIYCPSLLLLVSSRALLLSQFEIFLCAPALLRCPLANGISHRRSYTFWTTAYKS